MIHKVAALINSIRSDSLSGIQKSKDHRSGTVVQLKVNPLWLAIQDHIVKAKGHVTKMWSVISYWPHNGQLRSPFQPFVTKFAFVKILSCLRSQ